MVVSLKHAFNCALPDDPDTTVVRPSNWNAEHELIAADGAFLVGTGTGVEEQDAATALATMGAAAASHTHTASNVSDFSEAVDDRVAALLVAGTNVTLTYNDAAGTLTVASSGGGGGLVDGDFGDVVVSGTGTVMTIDSGVLSTFGRSLIDDANAAAARATLGLNLDILPFYQTRADLAAATVSASIDTIYVGGHTTEGKGAAVYVRLGSTPSPVKAWHIASADGAYWIIATWQRLTPEMLGAAADGSTNDTTVLQYTLDALATYPAINYATPAGA